VEFLQLLLVVVLLLLVVLHPVVVPSVYQEAQERLPLAVMSQSVLDKAQLRVVPWLSQLEQLPLALLAEPFLLPREPVLP
jgi:hypothetical protein